MQAGSEQTRMAEQECTRPREEPWQPRQW